MCAATDIGFDVAEDLGHAVGLWLYAEGVVFGRCLSLQDGNVCLFLSAKTDVSLQRFSKVQSCELLINR